MNKAATTITSLILLLGLTANAGTTEIGSGSLKIKCQADISALMGEDTRIFVKVKQNANGTFSGNVNGMTYNKNITPVDFAIRSEVLNISPEDIESDEIMGNLNEGATRLAHLGMAVNELGASPLTFDLNKVVKVKLYDLGGDSNTNTFGGTVLVEAFDSNNALLGRVFSSMLPGQCL